MILSKDNAQSIKYALLLYLITNRGMFGDIGLLAFYGLCLWFILTDGLYTPLLKLMLWIIVPMLICFGVGFINHPTYDVFKDVYYFLSPVFTIYVGCIIAQRISIDVLKKSFLIVGIISSIAFIIKVLVQMGLVALIDPRTARVEGNEYVSSAVFLSLGVLVWELIKETQMTRREHRRYLWMFFINLLAIYISASRTFWVASVAFITIAAWPYIRKHLLRFTIIGILGIAGIGAIAVTNPDNTTIKTMLHSTEEMSATKFSSAADRNNNYRAYEVFRSMRQFETYSLTEKVFGRGFGETIDMVISPLGMRYIPFTHNGYPYILIKAGYAGMLCFFIFAFVMIRTIYRLRNYGDSNLRMLCYLAIGGIIVGYIVHSSVNGLFNHGYNIVLMLSGAYIYYQNKNEEDEDESPAYDQA